MAVRLMRRLGRILANQSLRQGAHVGGFSRSCPSSSCHQRCPRQHRFIGHVPLYLFVRQATVNYALIIVSLLAFSPAWAMPATDERPLSYIDRAGSYDQVVVVITGTVESIPAEGTITAPVTVISSLLSPGYIRLPLAGCFQGDIMAAVFPLSLIKCTFLPLGMDPFIGNFPE